MIAQRIIVKKYVKNMHRKIKELAWINLEKNGRTIVLTRNIRNSCNRGKYITFMDSDDIIDKGCMKMLTFEVVKYDLDMVVWGMTEEYYNAEENVIVSIRLDWIITHMNQTEVEDVVIELENKTLFGYQCNHFYHGSSI